jgi:hypothetical protein
MIIWLRRILTALVVVLGIAVGQVANAYEEILFVDGGTLTGTVTLRGDVPKPMKYDLSTSPDSVYCGRISDGAGSRFLQPFQVDTQGAFRGVVVMLEAVARGKSMSFMPPRIEAIDCTFQPFISVVRDRRSIEVVNMDPVFHDVQAYETSRFGPRVLFNSPLLMYPGYNKGTVTKTGTQEHHPGEAMVQHIQMNNGRRVFVMQCGFHPFMEAWGLVVDHPYYAVTDREGHYTISDIPAGTYKVVVWHPLIRGGRGEEYQVMIKPKETTMLRANIDAPTGRLSANQLEDSPPTPRRGLDILGDTQTPPAVEKPMR